MFQECRSSGKHYTNHLNEYYSKGKLCTVLELVELCGCETSASIEQPGSITLSAVGRALDRHWDER